MRRPPRSTRTDTRFPATTLFRPAQRVAPLLQLLDPAEESLPDDGRVRFDGLEQEPSWLVSRVEAVRGAYGRRLQAQREGLRDICRALGWTCDFHRTDQPPQAALLRLYTQLSQAVPCRTSGCSPSPSPGCCSRWRGCRWRG